ncbi:MAG: hypothetical protein KDB53_14515 [Planctomycetes bacterium]|nr:hypothetical protein [Planctomycetota bacterium]
MSHSEPQLSPTVAALVDLVVRHHDAGFFVHDPAPSVLVFDPSTHAPILPDHELEKRSHTDVAHLAVGQLWSLLQGASPRTKLNAAGTYCQRRGFELDLADALVLHTKAEIERCFHRNRDFKVVQSGGMVWHVRRSLCRDVHDVVLDAPDRFLDLESAKILKNGRGTTVAETPGGAVLKRFNLKKYRNIVKHQFASSRARRAYQKAFHLELMGIKTPRAIAFADRTTLGLVHRSYLLMEQVPDVVEGAQAIREWHDERSAKRTLALGEAGTLVGRLHGAGFANRDLKASNLLAAPDGRVWLIDLDGVQHSGRVNEEIRIKNLRRMVRDLPVYGDLSLRDSLQFLRAYSRAGQNGGAKSLFRRLRDPE